MEVGFWGEETPWLLRRSESDPSPSPGMDRSLFFNESLYILQENFFVTGDERKKSFGKLFDGYFFLWYNKQRHMAKCLWREKYGGCGEVVNTADCGSVTRGFESHHSPHFFLPEIRYCRTSWGHRQAVRQRTLTPLSVVRLYLPLPGNRNEPEDLFAKKISSGSFFCAFRIDRFLCKK